jgi:hypothetical protein
MVEHERGLLILSFGIALLVSTVLSAAIIFGSDGMRAMHVTHPFVAMMLATGFSTPLSFRASDDQSIVSWPAGVGVIGGLMFVFLLGPPLISRVARSATAFDSNFELNHRDLRVILGRRYMTGFLVLPDEVDLPARRAGAPCLDLCPHGPSLRPRSRASLARTFAAGPVCAHL